MLKLGLLNILSLSSKAFIVNDVITDHNVLYFDRNLAKTRQLHLLYMSLLLL